MKICSKCKNELDLTGTVGRKETCPHCGADLRVCFNCRFYDPGAYNQCEYFVFKDSSVGDVAKGSASDVKSKLDSLFKK